MEGMSWARFIKRSAYIGVILGLGVLARPESQSDRESSRHAHEDADCTLCHRLVASLEITADNPDPTQQCRCCHTRDDLLIVADAGGFHQDQSRPCGSCHLYHEPLTIMAGGRPFILPEHGTATCSTCHNAVESTSLLSEGHQVAAQLFHADDPALIELTASEKCLLCHSEERTTAVEGISALVIPRFSEQHMHPVGEVKRVTRSDGEMSLRRNFDPRLNLNGDRIECHTCHLLTSQTKNRLVELGSPRDLCFGCHEYQLAACP